MILTTINAPYRTKLDAETLATCIQDSELAKSHAGPMSGFYMEIDEAKQIHFALAHGIDDQKLAESRNDFLAWAGYRK